MSVGTGVGRGTATLERDATGSGGRGGAPARRAVIRWAWRLFRREWRQQLLVLTLIVVAVAATTVGAGVATNTSPPNAGYGSADHRVTIPGSAANAAGDIAAVKQRFGTVDVIENASIATGAVDGAELRAQDPAGAFGRPMLSLVSGRYPAGAGEVALSGRLASTLGLRVGDVWHPSSGGGSGSGDGVRRVVGEVENPQNLLDSFALVAPGQLASPDQITVLFKASRFGDSESFTVPDGQHVDAATGNDGADPAFVVLVFAAVGLIFIGLVAVAGFTVLAQRRQRALGMLASLGATDRNVRLVMVANGALIGVAGALAGAAVGVAVWAAIVPGYSSSIEYRVSWTDLPWWLIAASMVLAAVTSTLASRRPARAIAGVPVVASLAGRPAPAKPVHRSVRLPLALLAAGFAFMWFSGGWVTQNTPMVLGGVVTSSAGLLLLAPVAVGALGAVATHVPFSARVALRDLARYRSRSGPTLAASSFAVFIAVVIAVLATGRFADSVDYIGPNLAANQLMIHAPQPQDGPGASAPAVAPTAAQPAGLQKTVSAIATALGTADTLVLDEANAGFGQCMTQRGQSGCRTNGAVWVATPALLKRYGIDPASIDPDTLLITSRHGLQGVKDLGLAYGSASRESRYALNPKIQVFESLPSGSAGPNMLVTQHAIDTLKISVTPAAAWLIQTASPITALQTNTARQLAAAAGMTIQGKDSTPSLDQVRNYATAAGILLALGVLAMTVGLIRSETAGDLRTLTATGAPRRTRRTITAATAGSLGLLAGVLGTAVAYLTTLAYFHTELSTRMSSVPVLDLAVILVGLPLVAMAAGWVFAGREPKQIARQPLE